MICSPRGTAIENYNNLPCLKEQEIEKKKKKWGYYLNLKKIILPE